MITKESIIPDEVKEALKHSEVIQEFCKFILDNKKSLDYFNIQIFQKGEELKVK